MNNRVVGLGLPIALFCSFNNYSTHLEYAGLFSVPTHLTGVTISAHEEYKNMHRAFCPIRLGYGDLVLQSKIESRVDFGDSVVGRDSTNLNAISTERCDETSTTCFVEAGGVVEVPIRSERLSVIRHSSDVTISQFLKRPMLLRNQTWANSSTTGTVLATFNPDEYINPGGGGVVTDAWYEKTKGFALLRGTFVIRLELNASPFMSGALLLSWMPQTMLGITSARYTSLIGAYQLPHVVVSTRDTTAEIRIPFISPYGYFAQTHALDNDVWGRVSLIVASQLQVGASAPITNCDVSVYGYWEDVELAAPIVPQGKTVYESLMPGKKVSQSMRTVSKIAGAFKNVPVVSGIASSVEWAANLAAGVASSLGFSNPVLTVNPALMVPRQHPYSHTADGPVATLPMSTLTNAAIPSVVDHTITDEDEMSLQFLYKVPTYMGELVWDTSNVTGTVLLSREICPRTLCSTTTDATYTPPMVYTHGGPLNYLSHLFSMWRGSIDLHLKFVKTGFHTGRLQIVWTPYDQTPTNAPTVANSMYALRHIVDIRDQDEYTVNLPYLLRPQYLVTEPEVAGEHLPSGTLTISVLNELRAPETCASQIRLLEFYTGGADFEFQAPSTFDAEPLRLQSAVHYFEDNVPERSLDPAVRCASESITSLKQLTSKASKCTLQAPTTATSGRGVVIIDPYHVGVAYANGPTATPNVLRGNQDMFSVVGTMYAYMSGSVDLYIEGGSPAGTYAVMPGILRKLLNQFPSTITGFFTSFTFAATDRVPLLQTAQYMSMSSAAAFTNLGGSPYVNTLSASTGGAMMGLHVPYVSPYPASFVVPDYTRTTQGGGRYPMSFPYPLNSIAVAPTSANTTALSSTIVRRSTGDDFRFKMFIGCPPLLISSHTS